MLQKISIGQDLLLNVMFFDIRINWQKQFHIRDMIYVETACGLRNTIAELSNNEFF
jgi:hypothetical protein